MFGSNSNKRKLAYAAKRIGPTARERAIWLNYEQRAIVISHIDKAVQIGKRTGSFNALVRADILTDQYAGRRADKSRLTEFGREVLAALLSEYAEGLVAAGFGTRQANQIIRAMRGAPPLYRGGPQPKEQPTAPAPCD